MQTTKTAKYRLRGYMCFACDQSTLIFGNDLMPESCPQCQKPGTLVKKWDQMVTTVTTVEPYLE